MSERTSSFSSATSCPSMTGPAASDSTLSPSVRSLSPISPLPDVSTFCLTPYPEQNEFPESISDSPIESSHPNHITSKPNNRIYGTEKGYIEQIENINNLNQNDIQGDMPDSGAMTPQSAPMKPIKPTPKRRQTSPLPSFSIPPSLTMSSLSSTTQSPTKPPPLSPGGRSKVPYLRSRPRIGRSATISTDTPISPNLPVGKKIENVRKFSGDSSRRKPLPLVLQKPQSVLKDGARGMNDTPIAKGLIRTKSLSSFSQLITSTPSYHSSTPKSSYDVFQGDYDEEEELENQITSPNSDSTTKTAKPLTSRRIGMKSNSNNKELVNRGRWFTELDLERLKLDMVEPEPRLGKELSPGWGEFDL